MAKANSSFSEVQIARRIKEVWDANKGSSV
ncbi:hypothetical protein AI2661V1_4823 [Citrobacter freundii]|nr:hypothetical protein AI2661V1_4823 [Citrobacter freundii]CAH4022702.1 hypothetical protein AI2661V1_4823 [Citrobacter freundii]